MNVWLGMGIVFITIFVATAVLGKVMLPQLEKRGMGQRIRDDGPQTHLKKSGTPTMGGLFFLLPIFALAIVGPFVFGSAFADYTVLAILMLLFGIIGFLDDYIKVRIDKGGLSVKQKTVLLGFISLLFAVYYVWLAPVEPFILLPFSMRRLVITGGFKILYAIFVVVYLFYVSNSVNITDGLDGLLSSLTTVYNLFMAVYLLLSGVSANTSAHIWLSVALAAGCLGFLIYNHFPAKVMMGDTGSQALGAGIAGVALLAGMPWMLLIAGFVFVFEGLSVVIQVLYFRKTGGKRIFRMAPIHHHFELGGWPEKKVVVRFAIAAVLFGLLGFVFIWPF